MILLYDRRSTGTTVGGRGNPKDRSQRANAACQPFASRFNCSRPPMAAPGGATLGWAGNMALRSPVSTPARALPPPMLLRTLPLFGGCHETRLPPSRLGHA